MGRYSRSIKIAFDKSSGEILNADEVFNKIKDAFQIRRLYHENKINLSCCECEQRLVVSGSKFDRLHFKHKPGHGYCTLSDGRLNPKDLDVFTKILISKESDRHFELKNKIGQFLKDCKGVDKSSIVIDNKFIVRGEEKRKPDVYCKFDNKEIVFEIQLSNLSLGYILSRYEFYRKHKMFLIWILDDFNIHNQGTLERDIKYLTKYENFFKLDENSNLFQLECDYKFPYLTNRNILQTKWLKKSVPFSELKFDNSAYQAYYFNYGDNRDKTEQRQIERESELQEIDRKRQEELEKQHALDKALEIISEIKSLRSQRHSVYVRISLLIQGLSTLELEMLNYKIGLKNKTTPIIRWLKSAKKDDVQFLIFLISCEEIKKDLSEYDSNGITAFQALINNDYLLQHEKLFLSEKMLEYGCLLNANDIEKLDEMTDDQGKSLLFRLCNGLENRKLTPIVFQYSKIIFIIESAKRKALISYKYRNNKWVQLANVAIEYHKEYWDYIESAFKRFDIWQLVEEEDTNGTFAKKLQKLYLSMPKQNFALDDVIAELYPEIYYA